MTQPHASHSPFIYAAFIAGLCSIIYELLIATTISYFKGDSVRYFSLTIGLYMAAMGAGSALSRYIEDHALISRFIAAETLLALLGGLSIPLLYASYGWLDSILPVYVILTLAIGFLIGLEVPLLTRILERQQRLQTAISTTLTLDYIGALLATLAFPFILLPVVGVYQSSVLFGLMNCTISLTLLRSQRSLVTRRTARTYARLRYATYGATALLCVTFLLSSYFLRQWDNQLYDDRIVYSQRTPYQHIVMTRYKDDLRLYLNGNLQFSSVDEYRYHESLIHLPLAYHPHPVRSVLLLGAGDGLAIRELLRYPFIEHITVVDLDPAVTELATSHPMLTELNEQSLLSDKLTIIHADAYHFLQENTQPYDAIIADLPDPNSNSLARLYSLQFYRLVHNALHHNGLFITQATSPYFAKEAFWDIHHTLSASPFSHITPYHTSVPSFGEWGFIMASNIAPSTIASLPPTLRYLTPDNIASHFIFPPDMRSTLPASKRSINTLDQPSLLHSYIKGWSYY